ncbi:VOC family protein [Herbiconiux sp. CPCC 203407]|uniref:VOC family protein n=1 Tax=Herbiconiux oxytropis TaxID=2970915 RepID=A0AA42BV59_9MICO|nr:VOC family protein [Herbiconiux oxytropis]MCS5723040.1 VOC family protein [Herbiconiux oxytropis]MCS5726891.1 VOC family protein [Herbiconiux oxytropis]
MKKLLGHIAHLEITAPEPEESAKFYVERFGMRIVDRLGDRIYLRCWGDYDRYSLVIAPGDDASLATMAWRVDYPEALDELVGRLDERGISGFWRDDLPAVGRAYEFVGPFGHSMTLFWEVEPFTTDPEFASVYPDRPERRAIHGAAPRFLDHVTVASTDVEGFAAWYSEALGFRVMAKTYLDHAPVNVFTVLTTNEKSHDLGIVLDTSDRPGRVHHIAFWTDHPEDLVRTADLMLEASVPIEYGPSIHGIGEQNFLYFREPSGLRVEVNSGGYRNYVPDWEARRWTPSAGSNNFFKNWNMPDSMMEAFPAAAGLTATEDGASPQLEKALANPWATTTGAAR